MNSRTDPHPHALVSALLDGELTSEESALVEAHLSGCASCRALLEDFRLIAASAGAEPIPPPSVDLESRIRGRLPVSAGFHGRRFRIDMRPNRLGLAAAAAAVLVVGLWFSRQGTAPGSGVPPAMAPPPIDDHRQVATGEAKDGAVGSKEVSRPAFAPVPPGPVGLADDERAGRAQAYGAMKKDVPAPPAAKAEPQSMPGASGASASAVRAGEPAYPQSQARTASAPPAAQDAIAPPRERIQRRTLRFEFPEYTVTLVDDGTLSLSSGRYACTARPETPGSGDAVTELFTLSSRPRREVSVPESPGSATESRVFETVAPADEGAASSRVDRPGTSSIDAATAVEMETRLRALLKDRYMSLLENRCGPVPEVVH